jgi:hypothetical protein
MMFGRILGKIISTPIRLANIPLKVVDKVTSFDTRKVSDRDPVGLDDVADAIDEACDDD